MTRNKGITHNRTGLARVGALALLLALAAPSCSAIENFNPFGGGKKKAPASPAPGKGGKPAAGASRATRLRTAQNKAAKAGQPGAATDTIDPVEAGFKKELGREDPFDYVPMKVNEGDMKKQVESFPELYRVIGTARTPQGPVAMLQMNTDSPIVHEGDILDSGAKVKQINTYSVILDSAGMEITLVMRTRKREAPKAEQPGGNAADLANVLSNISKIGNNVDALYDVYLKQKYSSNQQTQQAGGGETGQGETSSGSGAPSSRPSTFNDFINRQ